MNGATKRSILRWIHIVCTIPVLGYVYGPISEVQLYADAARLLFVPVIILTGYWMYAGAFFAFIGVAVWIGTYKMFGYETTVLSQVALFIARKVWLVMRARRFK